MDSSPPDWDLLAVVRSCTTTTTTATTTTSTPSNPPPIPQQVPQQPLSSNRECNWNDFEFLSSSSFFNSPLSSSSSTFKQQQPQIMRRVVRPSQVIFGTTSNITANSSQSHRANKKRKNLMKKVSHVPAEGLACDMWAWRKYGQKPIKGSPYPRGYYRCSSSKGCSARKQVERNRLDPKMFIVTYTNEHNHPMPTHRNSLAGSTRQKTGIPPENTVELSECKTEGEDLGGICDMMLNDDFFVGLEEIPGGSDDSDCFSEHFSPSSEFPWLSGGSTTATAAGGG